MIWLQPRIVTLGNDTLRNVQSISVDRFTSKFVEEWSDLGPYAVFADVSQVRLVCRIQRLLDIEDAARLASLTLGSQVTLSFQTAPGTSDAHRLQIDLTMVLRSVEHDSNPTQGMRQTITGVAISSDGATDPIIESEVTQ
jgi:hypothetical protein